MVHSFSTIFLETHIFWKHIFLETHFFGNTFFGNTFFWKHIFLETRNTTGSRGFAFAKVLTQKEADIIIQKFHENEIDGRILRVNMSGQKTERAERKTTTNSGGPGETELYVGSLAW